MRELSRRLRVRSLLLLALVVVLAACGDSSPRSTVAPAQPPAGWTSFVDPDHGWSAAYPAGWVVFTSANTHAWKNFVTADTRLDLGKRSVRLQPGDGLLTIGVDQASECVESREESTAAQSSVSVDGQDVDMYHWTPPTSVGVAGSEYAWHAVAGGTCYSVYLLFVAVPSATENSIVQGVTQSFRFA